MHRGFYATGAEPMTTERWASVEDAAWQLGATKDSVYRWTEPRSPPAHKTGRLWKFRLSEIDESAIRGAGKEVVLS